jgi:hypothetical protein
MWIFSKTKEVLGFRSPESVILSEVLSCPVRAFFILWFVIHEYLLFVENDLGMR